MIERLNAFDLALIKAKNEDKLLFYTENESSLAIETSYDYFYFSKFTSISSFCKTLRKICREISEDYEDFEYEFPKTLSNECFYVIIGGWKKVYVTNFPQTLNVNTHQKTIQYFFQK